MTETLEQFSERMSNVESKEEHQVGMAWQGNHRSFFVFEGQHCYLESNGYSVPRKDASLMVGICLLMKPTSDYWWTDFEVHGRKKAEIIAKEYDADIEAGWYGDDCENRFHFCFKDTEDQDMWSKLMRFVWERHTGEFNKKLDAWGIAVLA